MEAVIDSYKDIIVQIHTPGGSGSGFIVKDKGLIVTNRHVIAGSEEVVIRGENFKKTLAQVIYTDPLNDIAFLRVPDGFDESGHVTISNEKVNAGEKIIAIGHPLGLRFTATQGIVSKSERKFNNVDYIQVDAAINPGNSGGPLINERGEVVGVNTFIFRDGESLGFALPSVTLNDILREYDEGYQNQRASKCSSCTNLVTKDSLQDGYCPHCGNKFDLSEFDSTPYNPEGVSKTMESILTSIGKDVKLSRVGKSAWDIEEGSALIKITHNTQNRFIYCDAVLGSLPKQNIANLYDYMLKENYDLEALSFSVNQQNIVLGTIIYDADLNEESGKEILAELFQKADDYDNYMADTFGMELAENA
ncbi:trypsin-like peptidase domain-containing protein [Paracrocinitomix mangrovi]|uniref:trypsin-like peptidase domain-containing protein n=1 Tax=Paracrocinitomix mangrovi TaxID=2862509 RepID=UPI001C8E6E21|nr:trypsin-like peptidase domain-containing protein [Paracrocinitomix mangrovi]UKN03078.1 trypsin-like peptidase domain-containing protein [Paracrocinitomix mangrovi]